MDSGARETTLNSSGDCLVRPRVSFTPEQPPVASGRATARAAMRIGVRRMGRPPPDPRPAFYRDPRTSATRPSAGDKDLKINAFLRALLAPEHAVEDQQGDPDC